MYQALYRKWRPRTFDDVVGQDSVVETLRRQIVLERLTHAYLFTGTRGTGKTTCAKIFARAVNCEKPENGNPCNKCPSCVGIENGSILDVVEMDAASNNGVSDMRALRDDAFYTPGAVKKRVYIIDEVHMLSKDAFNALLKIMEEPPEHLMFILATTELHKVPATVLSRCQRFSFRRLPPAVISERLEKIAAAESLNLSKEAAGLLARLADGSMRDGISLLDQCSSRADISAEHVLESIGLAGRTETENLLASTLKGDSASALSILDRLYCEGKDVESVLEELSTLQRDILITKIAPKGGWNLQSGGYDAETLREYASKLPAKRLMAALETVQAALADMNRGGNRKIAAELCLMRLCSAEASDVHADALIAPSAPASVIAAETRPSPAAEAPKAENPPPHGPQAQKGLSGMPDTEPERPAENKAANPAPSSSGGEWEAVLSTLRPRLHMTDYMFVGEAVHAEGRVDGETITVRVKNPLAASTINKTEIAAAIKSAAEDTLKRKVKLVITDAQSAPRPSADKLDSLSKFNDIITFK